MAATISGLPTTETSPLFFEGVSNTRTLFQEKLAQRTVTPTTWAAMGFSGIIFADPSLSVCRNVLSLRQGWEVVVQKIGMLGGATSVFINANELRSSWQAYPSADDSSRTNTVEIANRAKVKFVNALAGISAGTLYTLSKADALNWIQLSSKAASVCGALMNAFWGISSVIAIALSILGIRRCKEFDRETVAFKTQPNGENALLAHWLGMIIDLSKDKVDSRIYDLKAATSLRAVQMILDYAPKILDPSQPGSLPQGMDASALIAKVQAECAKKQLVYKIGLVASIIGFVGLVLGLFIASTSALPAILFASSAAISLALTIANYMAPGPVLPQVVRPLPQLQQIPA